MKPLAASAAAGLTRLCVPWLVVICLPAFAQPAAQRSPSPESLADLDLEQLAQFTVTSPSRRSEKLLSAPASVFVITAEDIRRAGVTSLPDALRLAPNLVVARTDANQHVISARGGLTPSANKMLVLVDGRTVYTPLFSGVFYDALSVMVEDIERIEVISGPGSTLWGTNAVNGVINVTTRPAARTLGQLATVAAGNRERLVAARAGVAMESGAVRFYGRYDEREPYRLASGSTARDESSRAVLGLRGDWTRAGDAITTLAEAYTADVDNLGGDRDIAGGHMLLRWTSRRGRGDELAVQFYADQSRRAHQNVLKERRLTLDLDSQYSMSLGAQRIIVGAGVRDSRDRTDPGATLSFSPADRGLLLASVYVQNEAPLTSRLKATLGLRGEHNTYTGLEWLPNARLSLALSDEAFAWAAFTRTLRSPSRIDRDLQLPALALERNDDFRSEVANVAEAGYRAQWGSRIALSATAFYHRFERLRTLEPRGASTSLANGAQGRIHGIEGWADLQVLPEWRLVGGLLLMHTRTQMLAGRVNLTEDPLGNNPRHVASLRAQWSPAPAWQVDLMLRHVGSLPNPKVPAYTELDGHVGWRVSRSLELALRATNLLQRDHAEFGTPAQRALFTRGFLAKATWTF